MSESFVPKRKQTLLEKYDVPLEKLSFEFIKDCSDSKMLEKIVKILRSQEEGYYPQLQEAAETRLRKVDPSHKLLRVLEPVTKSIYPSASTVQALQDLQEWSSKISAVDKELSHLKYSTMPSYPEVRNASCSSNINTSETAKTKRTTKTTDYSSWDKYDPDAELLKLEVEEEKKKAERKREREKKQKEENERRAEELSKMSNESMLLAAAERERISEEKRIKGNEYFKAKDYPLAVKYYSESIAIQDTAAAYCNRALAYMKLNENYLAINDCSACLYYEPNNVKALFRRAQALQSEKQYHAAIKDVTYLLEIEPSNSAAITLRNSLLNQIGANQLVGRRSIFKRRIMVEDDESFSDGCVKIIEVSDDELRKFSRYEYVELNEKNQLKEMCMCSLDVNYHRRSEEIFRTGNSLISSPFYRITRVKHCYPVKVDTNRPSTSAIINSNYLHFGINTNYRTPVRNIFVVPDSEKNLALNSSNLNQRSSSATSSTNLNKMFDFRPKQNINEAITSKAPLGERHKGVLKNDLQKIMEVSRGIAEKRVDNLSTRLEILEIDSSVTNGGKASSNGFIINEKSESPNVVNSVKKSNAPCGSVSSLGAGEPGPEKASEPPSIVKDISNGSKDTADKSKVKVNGWIMDSTEKEKDSNLVNNNGPISTQCHVEGESGSCGKERPKMNGFKHSNEDLVKDTEVCKGSEQSSGVKSNTSMVNGHCSINGLTPFQFRSRWQNVEKSEDLSEYEMLLRQVKPSALSSVITNQLDDRMLSTMLSVLRSRFNLKEESSLVIDYLIAIAELERFGIALCLLSPPDVKVARGLFSDLESVIQVDLKRLSQFIQLKQAYLC
nr:PREDICTED: uncharacterized protein LOC109033254 isoform X2 [Bemisia tabaci]